MQFFIRVLATAVFWMLEYPHYSWRKAWWYLAWRNRVIRDQLPGWRKKGSK